MTKMKKIKIPSEDRNFSVDPTGFAPASLCDNNRMLHTYTTGPGPRVYDKTEKAPFQGLFLSHTEYARNVTNICCINTLYVQRRLFVKQAVVDNLLKLIFNLQT